MPDPKGGVVFSLTDNGVAAVLCSLHSIAFKLFKRVVMQQLPPSLELRRVNWLREELLLITVSLPALLRGLR